MDTSPLSPAAFDAPAILLSGTVDQDMYRDFRRQLDAVGRKMVIVFADNNFYGNNRAYFLAKLDLLKHYWKKKAFRGWAALVTNDFFGRPENLRLTSGMSATVVVEPALRGP